MARHYFEADRSNATSGNLSLSESTLKELVEGDELIVSNYMGTGKSESITVAGWMLKLAAWRGDYYLMPYHGKSSLCRR